MPIFKLTGATLKQCEKQKGLVVAKQYPFDAKGCFRVRDEEDAKKISRILCRYHGAKLYNDPVKEEPVEPTRPESTKASESTTVTDETGGKK